MKRGVVGQACQKEGENKKGKKWREGEGNKISKA